jgi:Putative prokaryotic signal transducing protein
VSWTTLITTAVRWEAELMQQLLLDHQIPARLLDLGSAAYLGSGSYTALQVHSQDQWTARLLLSPIEDEALDA